MDDELEMMFAAAADQPLPAGLSARILADAEALQPRRATLAPPRAPSLAARRPTGGAFGLLQTIGGWRGATGLTAAMLAGLWVGLRDPGGWVGMATAGEVIELMPGADNPYLGAEES